MLSKAGEHTVIYSRCNFEHYDLVQPCVGERTKRFFSNFIGCLGGRPAEMKNYPFGSCHFPKHTVRVGGMSGRRIGEPAWLSYASCFPHEYLKSQDTQEG